MTSTPEKGTNGMDSITTAPSKKDKAPFMKTVNAGGPYRWKDDEKLTTIVGCFNSYIQSRKIVYTETQSGTAFFNKQKINNNNKNAILKLRELTNTIFSYSEENKSYDAFNLFLDISKPYMETYMQANSITQGLKYLDNLKDYQKLACLTNVIGNINKGIIDIPIMSNFEYLRTLTGSYGFAKYVTTQAYADPDRIEFKNDTKPT